MEPEETHAKVRLGQVLKGKYRLVSVLGVGGMAIVYRAVHRNRAEFAVKILRPELNERLDVAQRFLREGYVANTVPHPGAVHVVDADVAEDGASFLVMELLDGVSVETLMDRSGGRLRPAVALAVAHGLLDVLASAHRVGIVHRDVKPANVFVTRDGSVKVLDFGIARLTDAETDGPASRRSGGQAAAIGTPAYMAPEQAAARSSDIEARTDVYGAGAMLFSMLSGAPVHPAETTYAALVFASTRPARLVASAAPDVPPKVASIVDRALQFAIADRWPDAIAMRDAVDSAYRDLGGPARASCLAEAVALAAAARTPEEMASAPTMGVIDPTVPLQGTLESRPVATTGARVRPSRRSWAWGAGLAAACVLASAAWLGKRATLPAPPPKVDAAASAAFPVPAPGSQPLVFILPFRNATLDSVFDYGTVELVLESALTRSNILNPMTGADLRRFAANVDPTASTMDVDSGRRLAIRLGAPVILLDGEVVLRDGHYGVSVRMTDAVSGAHSSSRATEEVRLEEQLVPAVQKLARELRAELGDPSADPMEPPGGAMSALLEVDHDYAVAQSTAGANGTDVIPRYEKALATDGDFALAHIMLGRSLINRGRVAAAEAHLARAVELSDRMSDRQRVSALSLLHLAQGNISLAMTDLEDALQRWPGDTRNTLVRLSVTYTLAERTDKALELTRSSVALQPHGIVPRSNLVGTELAAGLLDEAAREADRVKAEFGRQGALTSHVLIDALLGHTKQAEQDCREVAILDPSIAAEVEADVQAFDGRPDEAESLLRKSILNDSALPDQEGGEPTARKWATVAELRLQAKDRAGAVLAARKALSTIEPGTRFRATRVLFRAGATKLARESQQALAGRSGDRPRLYVKLLDAEAARARGARKEAVEAYLAAGQGIDSWLVHEGLGMTYLELGQAADAARELSWCRERRGQGAVAFPELTDSTLRYLPPVDAALARAKAGAR